MKKLLVILPAVFLFLASAPTLPADFLVVFVEAEGFFLFVWAVGLPNFALFNVLDV